MCGLSDSKCQQDLLCSSDLSPTSAAQAAKAREAVLRETELFGAGDAATTHRVAQGGGGRQQREERTSAAARCDMVSLVGAVATNTKSDTN